MRKTRRLILILAVVVAVAGLGVFLWWQGWFSPSSRTVVQDTLMRANAGDYEGAEQNLVAAARDYYAKRPELLKATLDIITRDRTISRVEIVHEEADGHVTHVIYTIHYKDGTGVTGIGENCFREYGKWRLSLLGTIRKAAPDYTLELGELTLAASKLRLQDKRTPVPRTKVSLRLPEGCEWNEKKREFQQKQFDIGIQADVTRRIELPELSRHRVHLLEKQGWRLTGQQDITVGRRKAVFLTFETKNEKGVTWQSTTLLLETGNDGVELSVITSSLWPLVKLAKECVLSAEWNP
jgi:hypothetical protein